MLKMKYQIVLWLVVIMSFVCQITNAQAMGTAVICYSDGSYSSSINRNKTPVGIAISFDRAGRPTKMVHLNQGRSLQWCAENADAFDMNLSTSYTDGRGNWAVICAAVSDEHVAGHYPAFEYANGLTEMGGGWYIPAKEELEEIHALKDIINAALYSLAMAGFNVDFLASYIWSSSSNSYDYAWSQGFSDGNQSNYYKDNTNSVRAAGLFNYLTI